MRAAQCDAPDSLDRDGFDAVILLIVEDDLRAVEGVVPWLRWWTVGGLGVDGVEVATQVDRILRGAVATRLEGVERALKYRQLESKEGRKTGEAGIFGRP